MWWTANDQEFVKWYNALKYSTVADLIAALPFPEETHSPLKDVENSHTHYENEKYRAAVGYLLQAIRKIYNYFNGGGMQLVDRGDPAANDFTAAQLSTDGTWHDLDLSAIVPAEARAVKIKIEYTDDVVGSYFLFRKKGNVNLINVGASCINVANKYISPEFDIFLDENRVIQYQASNAEFVEINITVRGWFT